MILWNEIIFTTTTNAHTNFSSKCFLACFILLLIIIIIIRSKVKRKKNTIHCAFFLHTNQRKFFFAFFIIFFHSFIHFGLSWNYRFLHYNTTHTHKINHHLIIFLFLSFVLERKYSQNYKKIGSSFNMMREEQ